MYAEYNNFPEATIFNVKLHNDYLLKLLAKTYKSYLAEFDGQIYIALFTDVAILLVFLVFWTFYYLNLIKDLRVHKSKFQEVSEEVNE